MHEITNLTIRDRNEAFCAEAKRAFKGTPIAVECGDILDADANVFVSPANSFGFMDGGIDDVYRKKWPGLEERVVETLRGAIFLAPGTATFVTIPGEEEKWLIVLPTMVAPMGIENTLNVFVSFRRLCDTISNGFQEEGDKIVCPGLGVGTGATPNYRACKQMRAAYDLFSGRREKPKNSRDAHLFAMELLK